MVRQETVFRQESESEEGGWGRRGSDLGLERPGAGENVCYMLRQAEAVEESYSQSPNRQCGHKWKMCVTGMAMWCFCSQHVWYSGWRRGWALLFHACSFCGGFVKRHGRKKKAHLKCVGEGGEGHEQTLCCLNACHGNFSWTGRRL